MPFIVANNEKTGELEPVFVSRELYRFHCRREKTNLTRFPDEMSAQLACDKANALRAVQGNTDQADLMKRKEEAMRRADEAVRQGKARHRPKGE